MSGGASAIAHSSACSTCCRSTCCPALSARSPSRIGFLRPGLIRAFLCVTRSSSRRRRSLRRRYASFNDFFTRRLRAGARRLDADPRAALCPVDGMVSQSGRIAGARCCRPRASTIRRRRCSAATPRSRRSSPAANSRRIYLAPHNYHRIHMPLAGTLRIARFVPGDLFSVNAATADSVPGLFARNERIACVFDTPRRADGRRPGRRAVRRQHEPCLGRAYPRRGGRAGRATCRASDPIIALDRGAELGWFNMGSTVVVLFAPQGPALAAGIAAGRAVRVGELLGPAAMNEPAWRPAASVEVLRGRAAMLARIRAYFAAQDVLEVQTPVLSAAAVSDPQIESIAAAPARGRTAVPADLARVPDETPARGRLRRLLPGLPRIPRRRVAAACTTPSSR